MTTTTILVKDGTHRVVERATEPPRAPPEPTAKTVTIGSLMSADVIGVSEDVRVEDVVTLLIERDVSALPVLDESGELLGLVSKTDIIRAQAEGSTANTVGELCIRGPRVLPLSSPLWEAAAVMSAHGLHHLPVVDDDGKLVGILSALDIVRWMADQEGWSWRAPKSR